MGHYETRFEVSTSMSMSSSICIPVLFYVWPLKVQHHNVDSSRLPNQMLALSLSISSTTMSWPSETAKYKGLRP